MDTVTFVPLGIGMASISLPLVPLIGIARGNTMSRTVLWSDEKGVRKKNSRRMNLPFEEGCYWRVAASVVAVDKSI
jgi:hypothetical protein